MKRSISASTAALILSLSGYAHASESISYPAMVWDDVTHVLSAPARWGQDEWQTAGWTSLAVVGTVAFIDTPVRNYMVKQDQGNKFWLNADKFGREYAFGTLGVFFVAGLLGNETSMQVTQDVVAASIISSAIIGVSVKTVVGRSRPLANQGTTHFAPFSDSNSSFFSGHSTQAFTLAAVVSESYNETWIDVTAYGMATLVAIGRTYHDKHFTSDVLTGAVVGTLVGKSVVAHNQTLRSGKLVLLPEIAPGTIGVRLAGSF